MKVENPNNSVEFRQVWKYYPFYHHITGGIKIFLFNITKVIKGMRESKFWALKDVNFDIKKGETVGFMGPNGAGKSTVLSLIAGVLRASKGMVGINGRVAPLLELGAGFHNDLSGRENIILNAILLGMTKRQVMEKLGDIIAFADLGEFIDQPIRTYSSGMIARLGFAVAVHTDPDILLVDEILAVGDENFQKKCYDRMNEFKQKGVTIVLVMHDRKTLEAFCSRIIELKEGKVVGSSIISEKVT